jgi:hypothetical protein
MTMATKYPPYVNGYGSISKLFKAIKDASVPPKFTNNFMQTALGLKSTSYRAMIPLLKKLEFIDQANIPTQAYKDYRDDNLSGGIMAECLRKAYSDLFAANEYAYKLNKDDLLSKLKTVTGAAAEDKNIAAAAGTFTELAKLADFDGKAKKPAKKKDGEAVKEPDAAQQAPEQPTHHPLTKLGISYTINLNLPATTEIEVFNAIFKSLKEHIINEE